MREQVEARPSTIALGGFVLGLTLLTHPVHWIFWLGLLIWLKATRSKAIFVLVTAIGLLLTPLAPVRHLNVVATQGIATVVSVPRPTPNGVLCSLDLNGETLRAELPPQARFNLGDQLQVAGKVGPLSEAQEPVLFPQGIGGRFRPTKPVRLISSGPWVFGFASGLRGRCLSFFSHTLPARESDYLAAMSFRAGNLTPDEQRALQGTGTIHLVAASGVHVFALAWLLHAGLGLLPLPRSWQLGLLLCGLALYGMATGLEPPTVRAIVMTALYATAYLIRREPDALASLCLALFMYLLWQPVAIQRMGFQLSAVVVGALVLFPSRRRRVATTAVEFMVREVGGALRMSAIAAFASVPILAYHTGSSSLVSIPANLLTVFPACIAFGVAMISAAVGQIVFPVGQALMTMIVRPLLGYVQWVTEKLNVAGVNSVWVEFSPYWLVLVFALALLAWRPKLAEADAL